MKIDKCCFKIDKTNAKAMIEGYALGSKLIRQAIWCDVTSKPFPMLITLNRTPTKFQRSKLGESLKPNTYTIPYKYIAVLDSEYPIKNDIRLWLVLCNNTLFNTWAPEAPYTRYAQSKKDQSQFRILLLRIYEIVEEFRQQDIIHVSDRIDHLVIEFTTVTIAKPVIPDKEFDTIKNLLKDSVNHFFKKYQFIN